MCIFQVYQERIAYGRGEIITVRFEIPAGADINGATDFFKKEVSRIADIRFHRGYNIFYPIEDAKVCRAIIFKGFSDLPYAEYLVQ